jgi:hypothetical protein
MGGLTCGWFAVLYRVHVPYVLEDMVSPRVLTMEFIDGVQVTDKDGLQVGCRLLGLLVAEALATVQQLHSARGVLSLTRLLTAVCSCLTDSLLHAAFKADKV